jgi:Outer membrane protein beta-barrel domain
LVSKKFLFFLLFGLIAGDASAQVLIGPTLGPNFSWITYENRDLKDVYKVSPVPGFHAGVMVSIRVQKRFFLNTSIVYSTKGKIVKRSDDPLFRHEATYKYIEMPIVYTAEFKGNFGANREYKWYFGAGPNVSYWLGGKGKFMSSDLSEINIDELSYKVVFKKDPGLITGEEMTVLEPNRIQLGLNIAAGFVFEPMGYQKIMLLFRYELGHSFMSRTTNGVFEPVIYEDEMRIRNQGLRISLSYLFDTKIAERKKGRSTLKKGQR